MDCKLVPVLMCLLAATAATTPSDKSVKVLLRTKWSQTPLYLETAEFLAEESGDLYWRFLEHLQTASAGNDPSQWTQQRQYQVSLELAERLLAGAPWRLPVLRFSLALRVYSPKVITFGNLVDDLLAERPDLLTDCPHGFAEMSGGGLVDLCHLERLNQSVWDMLHERRPGDADHPLVYSVDHVYPGCSSDCSGTVIVYAAIGSPEFFEAHQLLRQVADQRTPRLRYLVRHLSGRAAPTACAHRSKVALSGYGVELAIKSTEYKAQDDTRVRGEPVPEAEQPGQQQQQQQPDEVAGFVFSRLQRLNGALADRLNDLRAYLLDQEKEIATLKAWQLQEISLQAVTKVLSVQKERALAQLTEISQNFPTVARSLVKVHVEPELKREVAQNQQHFYQNLNLATSDTALFINGLYHDVDTVDVFALLDTMKQEYGTMARLYALLAGDHHRIRRLDAAWDRHQATDLQLHIRDGAVQYINDIENDRMYQSWPAGLHELLRPTYPGILRNVRRNLYHLVLVVSPDRQPCFDLLRMAESFYIHKAPVRIGLVWDVNPDPELTGFDDAGVAAVEAFNYVQQEKDGGAYEALAFLTDVIAHATAQGARHLRPDDVIGHFRSKFPGADPSLVFGADSSYDTGRRLARDFLRRTGLPPAPQALLNGVLLKESQLDADHFEDAVLTEIMRQTSLLRKAVYKNELTDHDDVLEWLMSRPTVMPRLNRILFASGSQPVLRLADDDGDHQHRAEARLAASLKYINSRKDCNPVTVWLASDFERPEARRMLAAALSHLRENSRAMRLALVFARHSAWTRALEAAVNTIGSSAHLLDFLVKAVTGAEQAEQLESLVPDQYRVAWRERMATDVDFSDHQTVANRLLAVDTSDVAAVVLNGKVLNVPLDDQSAVFDEADFALMERYATNFWTQPIMAEVLSESDKTAGTRKCSDLVMRLCSVMLSKPATTKQRYDISDVNEEHSVLLLEPRHPDQPALELTVILDPLTRGAQKISPILEVFHEVFNVRLKIFFNAVEKHSDMPLKLFYRFVLDKEPRFESDGRLTSPLAVFQSMPKTPLLTLGMAVPDNWMEEAVEAIYDLDNIHLAEVAGGTVWAVFELEHLLVEGHCFEQSTGSPPRGLQFTLGTRSQPTLYDTIVMANLGYFQLKAAPGVWLLRLRHGRSADIYNIVWHEGTDQVANTTEVVAVVYSFRSLVLKIKVNKKPDKQHEELLYDGDGSGPRGSDPDSSSGWFSGWAEPQAQQQQQPSAAPAAVAAEEEQDAKRINIFSVASGHLYERLLRIMMLSVLRHTKTPVKFWFLKNYLSPQFKSVLPPMAARYRFEYELVQYKWPRWLHRQTEKQRIIWGYKILFLDVLFPLHVKKIIFVDADQVVRADLTELRDLDLEGAPYGYTPFCDSRRDMDGFRFWKSGYWATHLHGRKYHISALYVVDLQKFRRIAAGDRLRGQYQGLSQDPNSLSNLDQDLPNNMIHQVAIKSLPQEWLWCETWCDDQSKARAKTIDLCNNPKTKEPKLTAARRIVAEWQDYDDELRQFLESLHRNGTSPAPDVAEQHDEL